MDKIIIKQCDIYDSDKIYEIILSIFESLGGVENIIKPGMKIAIKPNLVMRMKPEEAGTSNPEVIKAIVRIILENNALPIVCDSPGGMYTPEMLKSLYNVCGYNIPELTPYLNYDIGIENIKSDGIVSNNFDILSPIANADLVINVPKLKTHGMMVMTSSVKNYFGIIPGTIKAEYHLRMPDYNDFSNLLIDICKSVRKQITIIDAIVGMEGQGPTGGKPRKIGCIIGGYNPYALDYICSKIIGIDSNEVFTVKNSRKRNLFDENSIEIIGPKLIDIIIKDFDVPSVRKGAIFKNKFILRFLRPKPIFNFNTCTGCHECEKKCPPNAIIFKDKKPIVNFNKCIRCFCCHEFCPSRAIHIKRPWIYRYFGLLYEGFRILFSKKR